MNRVIGGGGAGVSRYRATGSRLWRIPPTSAWAAAALTLVLGACAPQLVIAGDCAYDTLGVSADVGNATSYISLGQAKAQSFTAVDTLVESITVWRPANRLTPIGVHLYINKAFYQFPIILDGGLARANDSEPPGGPIPLTWRFDPPARLPGPGDYILVIQEEACNLWDYPILYHTGSDAYPPGGCAYTWRATVDCFIPSWKGACPTDVDMCFRVVFCHDVATAVRRSSWGQLKILYR